MAAASVLKHRIDSLFTAESASKIIVMGDFNDEPWDESISEILQVELSQNILPSNELLEVDLPEEKLSGSDRVLHISKNEIIHNDLYSLIPPFKKSITGTLKFEGRWYLFDQFIVSGGLLNAVSFYETVIISDDFLLEPDEAYTGKKPFRTYNGYIYKGGYSDHLPVMLEIRFVSKK
jgi:hypothetical protein